MYKFFVDDSRTVDDINAAYNGMSMADISELEDARREAIRDEVDMKHQEFIKDGRKRMLTVRKLIEYLQKQDPDACILAYEQNSFAYIEQLPSLPSPDICTVAEDKARLKEDLEKWYKGSPGSDMKIKKEIDMTYRYANDNDVIIKFC